MKQAWTLLSLQLSLSLVVVVLLQLLSNPSCTIESEISAPHLHYFADVW